MAKRQQATGHVQPVYAVTGAEAFLKRQSLNAIMRDVLGDADRSMALCEYDGSSAGTELASVLDDVRTLPFLAERRLVIVRDADAFITRYREQLENYVKDPSSCGTLLLECKSLPGTTRLAKAINANGQVIKCEAPKPKEIPSWLNDRARQEHGCRLHPRAADMLANLVGTELGLLDTELLKLALYVGERKSIEPADVEALVGHTKEEMIWGILTAMSSGNLASAMQQWEDVYQTDRAASGRSIGGIAYSVRRFLAAKRSFDSGTPASTVAQSLMRWNETAQVQQELSSVDVRDIEDMLCRLLEGDVAAKTGGASVRTSIEAFIVKGCQRDSRQSAGR